VVKSRWTREILGEGTQTQVISSMIYRRGTILTTKKQFCVVTPPLPALASSPSQEKRDNEEETESLSEQVAELCIILQTME